MLHETIRESPSVQFCLCETKHCTVYNNLYQLDSGYIHIRDITNLIPTATVLSISDIIQETLNHYFLPSVKTEDAKESLYFQGHLLLKR